MLFGQNFIKKLFVIVLFTSLISCGGSDKVNQVPTVNVGEDIQINELQFIEVEASAFDSDGTITSILWEQTSGAAVDINDPSQIKMTFSAPLVLTSEAERILQFSLTVTDNKGATAQDDVTITVLAVNEIPLVNSGENKLVSELENITFSASTIDKDGAIVSVHWQQIAGESVVITEPNQINTSFEAPEVLFNEQKKVLEFKLTVLDNEGGIAQDKTTITVLPVYQNPIINLVSQKRVNELQTIELEASATDNDGVIVSTVWQQTSGEDVIIADPNQLTTSFQAPKVLLTEIEKVLQLTLIVIDNEGATTQEQMTITVLPINEKPIANAAAHNTYLVNELVQLDCLDSHDPDGFPVTFKWLQTQGPQVIIENPNACKPNFQLPNEPIDVEFSLQVTDEDQTTASDKTTVKSKVYSGTENTFSKETIILKHAYSDNIVTNFALDRSKGVAFVTDSAYFLKALDISEPLNIKELSWSVPGDFREIEIYGDLLIASSVIADSSSYKLWLFNISDINNIINLGVFETDIYASGIDLKDDTVFIVSDWYGINAYDISTPNNPIQLDTSELNDNLPIGTKTYDGIRIKIVGDFLYVTAEEEGLKVFDISTPSQASLAGELSCDCMPRTQLESNDDKLLAMSTLNKGIALIDISTPTAPNIMSFTDSMNSGYPFSLHKSLIAKNEYKKISFIDIANPDEPKRLAFINTTGSSHFYFDEEVMFLARYSEGLVSYDMSVFAPPVLTKIELDGIGAIGSLAVDNGKLYTLSYPDDRLSIFDISNHSTPQLLGDLILDVYGPIAIENNNLFFGKSIVDISNDSAPQYLSQFPSSNMNSYKVTPNGEFPFISANSYMSNTSRFLTTANLTDPLSPTIEEKFIDLGTIGYINDTFLLENKAYVLFEEELIIIDITTPSDIKKLSSYDIDENTYDQIIVDKNYVYLLSAFYPLKIIDVSDVNNPVLISQIEELKGHKIKHIDDTLYIMHKSLGVSKYSFNRPLQPKLTASFQYREQVSDIAFFENKIINQQVTSYGLNGVNWYSVFDFDKSLNVAENNAYLTPNQQYTYNVTWQLEAKVTLGCIVSGGECQVISDVENKKAEITWTAPQTPGDYQISILIGNTSFFDSYEDNVIVQ